MSTFTRDTESGSVIYFDGINQFGLQPTLNIFPHPREANKIMITDDTGPKEVGSAIIVDITEVSEPTFTDRNDLISKLKKNFFFKTSTSGTGDMAKSVYDPAGKNEQLASVTDVNNAVTGMFKDRGNYDASGNTFPTTGGSGTGGAIKKGDVFLIYVAGTLGSKAVEVGDGIRALVDTPGQTAGNWAISERNFGFVPEDSINKENTTLDESAVKYPTNRLVKFLLDLKATLLDNTFVGKQIFKGTTNDGSTNIAEFRDSDNILREKIDTKGFKQVRYRDEYPSGQWQPASGGAAPDTVGYTIGGIGCNRLTFDGGGTEEKMSNSFEIPHDIALDELNAETEFIEAHIHWAPSTNSSGNVEWHFDYCYRPSNAAPISQTPLHVVSAVAANQIYFHKLDAFKDGSALARIPKPAGGFNLGDLILFNIRRTPSGANDTYTGDAILEQVALHVPVNDSGSRQIYVK